MNRVIYCKNDAVSLAGRIKTDDRACYDDWMDPETQKGYNFILNKSYEEFCEDGFKSRFTAMIMRNSDGCIIGSLGISPPGTIPDLSIRIFKRFRHMGYGASAFSLATDYALNVLKLDEIHAGAYQDNPASLKMIEKCGYTPFPDGNMNEKHYLTGEDIVQFDFVYKNNRR